MCHVEDSRESSLTPVLELSILYDMYHTRVHQIKSNSIHGGDLLDKCDSHYMKTQQSRNIRKATDYYSTKYRKTNTSNTYAPPRTRKSCFYF